MATSNNDLITFHEWVARRIQSHDFITHPVSRSPFTWTLESDIENYLVEYLAFSRSEAETNEFLDLRNRVRNTPTPPGMSAQAREDRDRRLMYGHAPDLPVDLQPLSTILDTQIKTGHHWQQRIEMQDLMFGIPVEDIAGLLRARDGVVRCCWTMLILNETTLELSRDLTNQVTIERGFMRRIMPIMDENWRSILRSLEHHQRELQNLRDEQEQQLATARREQEELNTQRQQSLGRTVRTVSGDGSEQESPADQSEGERAPHGEHPSPGTNSPNGKYALPVTEPHGDIAALAEALGLSSSEDEDSHVNHRADWHEPGNILGDCPLAGGRRQFRH